MVPVVSFTTVPPFNGGHPHQLVFLAGHTFISGQRNSTLVNGRAAAERHHTEPGVVDGDGAGVDGRGVTVADV